MKVDFKLHTLGQTEVHLNENKAQQEIGFSLVGQTIVSRDVLTTPKTKIRIQEETKNKVLTELVNLLQLELYGKVMSNEPEQEEDLGDIKHPICPINIYFEGDEKKCDTSKCDWDIEDRSCSQMCEIKDKQEETKCKKSD